MHKLDPTAAPATLSIQPVPVQTLLATLTTRDGASYTMVVRRWSALEVSRCRLCRTCSAKVGLDRSAVCIVAVADSIDPAEASLYAEVDP